MDLIYLLLLFIFCSVVFLTIQSVKSLFSTDDELERLISPSVTAADVKGHGDVGEVDSIISALKDRANNPFYSSSGSEQIGTISVIVSRLSKDIRTVKMEILVFKMIVGAVSIISGTAAAILALNQGLSGYFGS